MAERLHVTQKPQFKDHPIGPGGIMPLESLIDTIRHARIRAAYSFIAEHWSPGKTVDKREHEMRDILTFAKAHDSLITLADFPVGQEELDEFLSEKSRAEKLKKSTFMPVQYGVHPIRTEVAKFVLGVFSHGSNSIEDRDYFKFGGEGAALMEDFNDLAYQRIQKEYGLDSINAAKEFFDDRIIEANEIIRGMTESKLPTKVDSMGLLSNTSLMSSPGKIAYYILSPHTKPRLKYEAMRTLTIAELLAKSERHSQGLIKVLDDFHTAIEDNIFNHGQGVGDTKNVTVYAIFDKDTGEPYWNSSTDAPLSPGDHEKYERTGILKQFDWEVRSAPDVGDILSNPRTKEKSSIFEKMIRDAETRKRLVGDTHIEPAGITDLGGIMHVLLGENDLHGHKINELIAQHVQLANNTFDDVVVIPRDSTSKEVGQSDEHKFRRVDFMITRNGRTYKIEVIFKPLTTYLADEFKYGEYDPDKKLPGGPAHPLFEAIRSTRAAIRLFPPGRPEQKLYGPQDWDTITSEQVDGVVEKLRAQHSIDYKRLPSRYLQEPLKRDTETTSAQPVESAS